MNNKAKDYRILYFLVTGLFLLNPYLFLDKDNSVYAFLGFFLSDGGGITEQEKTYDSSPISLPFPAKTTTHTTAFSQTHGSLHLSECYFPYSDIINSCNTDNSIKNNNTIFNFFGLQ